MSDYQDLYGEENWDNGYRQGRIDAFEEIEDPVRNQINAPWITTDWERYCSWLQEQYPKWKYMERTMAEMRELYSFSWFLKSFIYQTQPSVQQH